MTEPRVPEVSEKSLFSDTYRDFAESDSMSRINRRNFLSTSLLVSGATILGPTSLDMSRLWGKDLPPGVETTAKPSITGEERLAQPDLWALEVNFKPIRMIFVDLPDQQGGKPQRRLIWYLCYRVLNRPVPMKPAGEEIPLPDPGVTAREPIFVPEFTLVTDDNNSQKVYIDRVMPTAQKAINKRERQEYKNSVEIVGSIPPVTPYGSKTRNELYGVATWRGIDPTTDRFTVFMTGFSNGYEIIKGPNDEQIVNRKTLVQQYWRPSDEFDEEETEIRPEGEPQWIYRP